MQRYPTTDQAWPHVLLDVLLRVGIIALLVYLCFRVFHPFLNLMLWSVILAVTLYPLHRLLRPRLGGRDGLTATLIVIGATLLLIVPALLLCNSLVGSAMDALKMMEGERIEVPAPRDSVAEWPVIGPRVHASWSKVASDPHLLVEKLGPRFKAAGVKSLGALASIASGFLLFVVALPIAGIFMAYGKESTHSAIRIASWLSGPARGPQIATLCTATIRAVAQGVIGIAFIQALLVGIGFVLMDVPAAGLLALGVLLLGIMQVPATLLTIPVIVYVIATQGATAGTIAFSIYVFLAGLSDNVLKPLLLGRGVEVPMPVVLIGALGGMITGGLLGLFIGPVVLGVGYELFWRWVDERVPDDLPPTAP